MKQSLEMLIEFTTLLALFLEDNIVEFQIAPTFVELEIKLSQQTKFALVV